MLEALPLEAGVLADAWFGNSVQVRMTMHYEAFKLLTGTAFNVDLNQLEDDCSSGFRSLFSGLGTPSGAPEEAIDRCVAIGCEVIQEAETSDHSTSNMDSNADTDKEYIRSFLPGTDWFKQYVAPLRARMGYTSSTSKTTTTTMSAKGCCVLD